jgi:hypothetical protein
MVISSFTNPVENILTLNVIKNIVLFLVNMSGQVVIKKKNK